MRRSKILLTAMVAMLCITALCFTVSAEDSIDIKVASPVCEKGEIVEVNVSVANNSGFAYLKLDLDYDTDALTLVGVNNGTLVSDFYAGNYYVWSAETECTENGVLATFVFEAADDLADGQYAVTVNCIECSNYDEEDVVAACHDGAVVIGLISMQAGDIDANGAITIRDAAIILQYIALWEVNVDVRVADVDCDGDITVRDAVRILQYIVGWDVTLGA